MRFERAMLKKGNGSIGFYIPQRVQEKFNLKPRTGIYFVKIRGVITGYFYKVPDSTRRGISNGPKRPMGGRYLYVITPKGWVESSHVSVFWSADKITIHDVS